MPPEAPHLPIHSFEIRRNPKDVNDTPFKQEMQGIWLSLREDAICVDSEGEQGLLEIPKKCLKVVEFPSNERLMAQMVSLVIVHWFPDDQKSGRTRHSSKIRSATFQLNVPETQIKNLAKIRSQLYEWKQGPDARAFDLLNISTTHDIPLVFASTSPTSDSDSRPSASPFISGPGPSSGLGPENLSIASPLRRRDSPSAAMPPPSLPQTGMTGPISDSPRRKIKVEKGLEPPSSSLHESRKKPRKKRGTPSSNSLSPTARRKRTQAVALGDETDGGAAHGPNSSGSLGNGILKKRKTNDGRGISVSEDQSIPTPTPTPVPSSSNSSTTATVVTESSVQPVSTSTVPSSEQFEGEMDPHLVALATKSPRAASVQSPSTAHRRRAASPPLPQSRPQPHRDRQQDKPESPGGWLSSLFRTNSWSKTKLPASNSLSTSPAHATAPQSTAVDPALLSLEPYITEIENEQKQGWSSSPLDGPIEQTACYLKGLKTAREEIKKKDMEIASLRDDVTRLHTSISGPASENRYNGSPFHPIPSTSGSTLNGVSTEGDTSAHNARQEVDKLRKQVLLLRQYHDKWKRKEDSLMTQNERLKSELNEERNRRVAAEQRLGMMKALMAGE